jgi:hypothetical protein
MLERDPGRRISITMECVIAAYALKETIMKALMVITSLGQCSLILTTAS